MDYTPSTRPVVQIISQATMESLTAVYLNKVDRCYGFIDHDLLWQCIRTRWAAPYVDNSYDAVLCGVAALGSLFSHVHVESTELDLIESAKHILEQSSSASPNEVTVIGWVLRVAYLRMTAPAHTAWLASCTTMHVAEAAGIHRAYNSPIISESPPAGLAPEYRSRILGIARHLNIWISYDLGRSRVIIQGASLGNPSARPGDYTTELLGLLSLSDSLGPEKEVNSLELKNALWTVMKGDHSEPPSVLAQCNVVLCIIRRLLALDFTFSGDLLEEVLDLLTYGIRSAETMLNSGNPWHHVANIPFQVVCILLAIDSPSSISRLGDAMKALNSVAQIYNTDATKEALNIACLLILLHQRRKDTDAKSLATTLQMYSPSFGEPQNAGNVQPNGIGLDDLSNTSWFNDLMVDMPTLQDFDVGLLFQDTGALDNLQGWV